MEHANNGIEYLVELKISKRESLDDLKEAWQSSSRHNSAKYELMSSQPRKLALLRGPRMVSCNKFFSKVGIVGKRGKRDVRTAIQNAGSWGRTGDLFLRPGKSGVFRV